MAVDSRNVFWNGQVEISEVFVFRVIQFAFQDGVDDLASGGQVHSFSNAVWSANPSGIHQVGGGAMFFHFPD